MTKSTRPIPGAVRPTSIGPFNAPAGETNRTRAIPAPWIDCDTCTWRHFPSTTKGRWFIATTCTKCGAQLKMPVGVEASGIASTPAAE